MKDKIPLPKENLPFIQFATKLREGGFNISPEQTQNFIAAISLLGPKSIYDIYRASHAIFGPQPDRRSEFDIIFKLIFLGETLLPSMEETNEDIESIFEKNANLNLIDPEEVNESGGKASGDEKISERHFSQFDEDYQIRNFKRKIVTLFPRRKSRRLYSSKRGKILHLQKLLKESIKGAGEFGNHNYKARREKKRRVVLMIDVSGSMKDLTSIYIKFANAFVQHCDQFEVFTLGTRLTRITNAIKNRNQMKALSDTSKFVRDWDGGTRLGDSLSNFLSSTRYVGFCRGSILIILSDGLERGEFTLMTKSIQKLSKLCRRMVWLSPLVSSKEENPKTGAMMSILPYISYFGSASNIYNLCNEILSFMKRKPQ